MWLAQAEYEQMKACTFKPHTNKERSQERSQALLTACDAEGPDPLFGGAVAAQRAGFPMMQYLVLRMHAAPLAAAGLATLWETVRLGFSALLSP